MAVSVTALVIENLNQVNTKTYFKAVIASIGKRFAEEEFILLLAIVISRFSISVHDVVDGKPRVPLIKIPTISQVCQK